MSGREAVSTLARRLPFPYRAPTTPGGVDPAPKEAKYGAAYDTGWAREFPARLARLMIVQGLMRPIMQLLASPEVRGTDRLTSLDEGAAIFAANHHSHIDTPLMLSSIPEPWRHQLFIGAAADYFFKTRATSALSALAIGAIPIERTKVTRRSADQAAELLDGGWSMLIFPEGGRSPDGWGQPFRGGAAYLALRCEVPVVPIHLEGTGRIMKKGTNTPRPSTTRITFGSPMWPGEDEDSRSFAVRIEQTVAALADEATTDWWHARQRAHHGDTPGLTGPEGPSWRREWSLSDRRRRGRAARRWPELS